MFKRIDHVEVGPSNFDRGSVVMGEAKRAEVKAPDGLSIEIQQRQE